MQRTRTPHRNLIQWLGFRWQRIMLSTTSWIGGKNGFLGWVYLVVGVVCLVLALAFAIKMQMAPRQPGHAAFIAKDK